LRIDTEPGEYTEFIVTLPSPGTRGIAARPATG
jgi:hypothetical protein